MEKQYASQISSSLPRVFSPILLRLELKSPNKSITTPLLSRRAREIWLPASLITGTWECVPANAAATAHKAQILSLLFLKGWGLELWSSWKETPPVRAAFLCSLHKSHSLCHPRVWKKEREWKEISEMTPRKKSCIRKPQLCHSLPHSKKKRPHSYYPQAVRVVQLPFPNTAVSQ